MCTTTQVLLSLDAHSMHNLQLTVYEHTQRDVIFFLSSDGFMLEPTDKKFKGKNLWLLPQITTSVLEYIRSQHVSRTYYLLGAIDTQLPNEILQVATAINDQKICSHWRGIVQDGSIQINSEPAVKHRIRSRVRELLKLNEFANAESLARSGEIDYNELIVEHFHT